MRNAGREKISIATRSVLTTKHNNNSSFALCCVYMVSLPPPAPKWPGGWMDGGGCNKTAPISFPFRFGLLAFFFFSGEENEEESGMLSLAPTSATHAIYCTTHTHARACTFRVTVTTPRLSFDSFWIFSLPRTKTAFP
jgi:hypothetical protein